MDYSVVGSNIDTLLLYAKGELPSDLDHELDRLKAASQEADADLATSWIFAGETLFIRAHGSGRQWRWILHCPSLHLDVGRGRFNGLIVKARLSSACLWERSADVALALLYAFLVGFLGQVFALQVAEVHLCADLAGWELALEDARAFLTRGHNRRAHLAHPSGIDQDDAASYEAAELEVNLHGRRCTGFEFSKGGVHSCTIYDKTKELTVSRKDWMRAVWAANGWDGASRVTRVEFRYKRECLHEMGVEEAYALLDQVASLWAYSTRCWLRHSVPQLDLNRGRWPLSPAWAAIQRADPFGEAVPAVRTRKRAGDLKLLCQMLAGCSTTAAAMLVEQLPQTDDGSNFLRWFYEWMLTYLEEKGMSFEDLREDKRLRLGVAAL